MDIRSKINNILSDFVVEVNEAILNKNFEKIKTDEHTITIDVLGYKVTIWNVEDQDTHIYRIDFGNMNNWYIQGGQLKKPKTCRKILRADTPEEIEANNKKIDEEIAILQNRKG